MPAEPKVDLDEIAAEYGYTRAFLEGNPELRRIFRDAIKQNWTPQKIVAETRATKWYRTHSEAQRNAVLLKKSDPKEWVRRNQQMQAHVKTVMQQSAGGLRYSDRLIGKLSQQAVTFGWTEEEISQQIARSTNFHRLIGRGELGGTAGQLEDNIRQWTGQYGVKVSDKWIADQVRRTSMVGDDPTRILSAIQNMAKNQYKRYAKQIDEGQTVRDLAENYIQTMAQTLEMNPGQINVHSGYVQKAMTSKEDVPIWEFANELRHDSRWMQTQQAQDQLMGTGRKLLTDMGLKV